MGPGPLTGRVDNRQSGFTLLELLVVVVIIAVMAGVFVASLDSNPARRLSAEAERLVLLINLAQQQAIMSSRPWRVSFAANSRQYQFSKWDGEKFELVEESPYGGVNEMQSAEWGEMNVNAQVADEEIELFLFPSGEHDQFSIQLRLEQFQKLVSMNPVGEATLN